MKKILTTFLSINSLKGDLEVYLGAYVLANKKEKDRINLKITVENNIIVHEEYDHRWPLVDNIAIITLDEEVQYTGKCSVRITSEEIISSLCRSNSAHPTATTR